jgi:Ca2+/Na+ antiporter
VVWSATDRRDGRCSIRSLVRWWWTLSAVTGLAVGLLLAGAEPEELITAVIAAARGQGGIAAGDAIGANITMLTLVVGLAAFL